ncbi:MAG TPA: hypothetical protein VFU22_07575 [Roseiflexaceae bacterium]|nr:hypothetical protein [Roseiflexaceae bacterium]
MTIHPDPQLNDADLDLLSAYIDRQLDDGERAALEQRLSAEPALRGALEELRATVALLRDLEPLKPPRSFTIAAAAPRRAWLFPWPAIGSALVAMVCLLTFSFVLMRAGGQGGSAASAPAPAAMEAAAATAMPAAPAEAPVAGGVPDTSAMRQSAAATAAPAAEAPAAPMAAEAPTAAPAAEAPMAAAAATTATPAATLEPAPSPVPAEAPVIAAAPTAAAASGQAGEPAPSAADSVQANTPDQAALKNLTPEATQAQAAAQGDTQSTIATAQQNYSAQVATSEISSPGTVALEQPPAAPAANSAPSARPINIWLIAGLAALLAIGVAVALALRARGRT